MVWNWFRRHPNLVDGAIVLVVLTVQLGDAFTNSRRGPGFVLALLQALPLAVRRRWPIQVLALVAVGTVGETLLHQAAGAPLGLAVAMYTVGAQVGRRRSALAGGLALAGVAVAIIAVESHEYPGLILFAAAWVVGDNVRTRRAYYRELEQKAERLERERDANIQRAAAEEQARISRELHDVIAHNVSVMTVQASAARDVFDTDPGRAREALGSIESTGRAALTELRRLLSTVRDGGPPELAPQPGLGSLEQLAAQVRQAGLAVEVRIDGERPRLPAALDLSAYRIVQEALTNTLKHASARRAWVDVRYGPTQVELSVRDDGIGAVPNGTGSGRGLVGMRERVELFGGSLDAGPQSGGGYAVSAHLPLATDE